MVYLREFNLVDEMGEHAIMGTERRNIFNSYYPIGLFSIKDFDRIVFDNVTIFYGGNGSGKTTLLNMIAEKVGAIRKTSFDKGKFFDIYVKHCNFEMYKKPSEIKIITSDDIFDYLLDIRSINSNVNRKKELLSQEYLEAKFDSDVDYKNYEELKRKVDSRKMTMSKYVRTKLGNNNIIEQSNGESALMFWEKEIDKNSLYILDEPENSLSAENQLKLKKFLEESARFFNCQFIIATHSPFILSMADAKIYDLDLMPIESKKWTELANIKIYHDFFKKHDQEFGDD